METLAYQLTAYSAAEVALLLVALQYFVLAPAWIVAALVLPGDRRAAAWWAVYSSGSAVGLLLIVIGMHETLVGIRAAGNVLVFAATLSLLRGIWAFTGQPAWNLIQALMMATTTVLCWLAMDAAWVWVRITFVAAMWAALYFWAAVAVWAHVRRGMRQRWGLLYAAPMLLAAVMLALRSLRAIGSPETVVYEVEQNTVLSVGSAITGLVPALLLQMMLVSLLVSRLVGRLERLSRHDSLTGLLNRRAMDELLAQEEQRARRRAGWAGQAGRPVGGQMAVLMIDIDYFKRLNDSQGHATGERALQHLATLMGSRLRDIDHLARWGGEEFLALLPATAGADALALAERLCERVRNLSMVADGTPLPLTVSIGVAEWLGPHDSIVCLLGRADRALYEAKQSGRDRVVAGLSAWPLAAVKAA
ncbi:MAG: GGDEF domain-containing protein [Microbacteriaceae bacterium]|nr:GGDEF domain-containing protein [Burkholderiaceae bacterium]